MFCFIFLRLAPLLPELLEFVRTPFIPVALHDDMSIEMIKGTVAFCTVGPRALIQTLDLIVAAAGSLSDCISRKSNK
jgi:hypothetical protein